MELLAEKSIKIDDITIYLSLFQLHKSFLLLISDQNKMGIGTVTLGSPPIIDGVKPPTTSFNLFGVDSNLLSTIIAERASHTLKAPVLLLLFLRSMKKNEEIIKPLIIFLDQVLKEIVESLS